MSRCCRLIDVRFGFFAADGQVFQERQNQNSNCSQWQEDSRCAQLANVRGQDDEAGNCNGHLHDDGDGEVAFRVPGVAQRSDGQGIVRADP